MNKISDGTGAENQTNACDNEHEPEAEFLDLDVATGFCQGANLLNHPENIPPTGQATRSPLPPCLLALFFQDDGCIAPDQKEYPPTNSQF